MQSRDPCRSFRVRRARSSVTTVMRGAIDRLPLVRSGVDACSQATESVVLATSTKSPALQAEAVVPVRGSPAPEPRSFRRRHRPSESGTRREPFSRDHLNVAVTAQNPAASDAAGVHFDAVELVLQAP